MSVVAPYSSARYRACQACVNRAEAGPPFVLIVAFCKLPVYAHQFARETLAFRPGRMSITGRLRLRLAIDSEAKKGPREGANHPEVEGGAPHYFDFGLSNPNRNAQPVILSIRAWSS